MSWAITWLHLSDLHACKAHTGWDAARVIKTLRSDLQKLQRDQGLRPELLFFTGDLAFGQIGSGAGESIVEQFKEGTTFLESIRTAFTPELPKGNVYIVPGNHDVNRSEVTADQITWLDGQTDRDTAVGLIRIAGRQWRRYMERLDNYAQFLKDAGYDHLLNDPKRLIYAHLREVNGAKLGIAGFNSAWSCSRSAEKSKLWTGGVWQGETLLADLEGRGLNAETDVCLALIHHPGGWFVEHEANAFWRQLLQQQFRFCLHGHEHEAWVETPNRKHVTIAAGACYQGSRDANGYNLVRLDLESGVGEVWLREYRAAGGGGWVPLIVPNYTDDRGVWAITLDWLKRDGGTKASTMPAGAGRRQKLLDRASAADSAELVDDLLSSRWTLAELEDALDGSSERAMRVLTSIAQAGGDYWQRMLAAYVASRVRIPPAELIALAYSAGLAWGQRFPPLSFLRFTTPALRHDATKALLEAMGKQPLVSFDNEQLATFGLGHLGDDTALNSLLEENAAFQSSYANEKLGPYAVRAYLHCYERASWEMAERWNLDYLTQAIRATEAHGKLSLNFYDYFGELQCLPPGKAVGLFRHLRDNDHGVPLSAVLAALNHRPAPLLLSELLELGRRHKDPGVASGALNAAAYIGTADAEQQLKESIKLDLAGARAAYLIAAGLTRDHDSHGEVETAIGAHDGTASWLNDVYGNALWAAGELGIEDPAFAARMLGPVRTDPHIPDARGLAWLGLAKCGQVRSRAEIDAAIAGATKFVERLLIATAATIAGWPDAMILGIRGTIDNHSPIYRLVGLMERDVRMALTQHCGEGGKALVTLLQLGDFV